MLIELKFGFARKMVKEHGLVSILGFQLRRNLSPDTSFFKNLTLSIHF